MRTGLDRMEPIESPRLRPWEWVSDGRGNLRIKTVRTIDREVEYRFRAEGDESWQLLQVWEFADVDDDFGIAGFGDSPNEFYVFDSHEGRAALFRENLGPERGRELVFAHPKVDVDGVAVSLGRHHRIVGAAYTTDRGHIAHFDPVAERVHAALLARFPGESGELNEVTEAYPALADIVLSPCVSLSTRPTMA